MEDFSMNISLDRSFNNSNFTFSDSDDTEVDFIRDVLTYVIVSIGLPLTLVALYSLVRSDHGAPIYVINLLITDLLQLCSMIAWLARDQIQTVLNHVFSIYCYCMVASVGFMVCVAMERYLLIARPLWYRFRRSIKSSVEICVVVWVLPIFFYWFPSGQPFFLLLSFPLFIFFLVGTLKALSASISVTSDEKRQIVGILVLVLLIYTLLFLPLIILLLVEGYTHYDIIASPASLLVQLSPLADVLLYVFMKKGIIDKLWASVCCCRMANNCTSRMDGNDVRRMDSNDIRRAGSNDISITDNSDISRMDSNDIKRMDSNYISRTGSNDIKRMDNSDISRTDSNDIITKDSNDIKRMDSNDISRTGSNDIKRMDSNDISRTDSNDIITKDSNDISIKDSSDISRMGSNDISIKDNSDTSRMGSNDINRVDSNDISIKDNSDTSRTGSNDIKRMDSNDISRTGSNDIKRMGSNDISIKDSSVISRMGRNDIKRMDSNDISSTSV